MDREIDASKKNGAIVRRSNVEEMTSKAFSVFDFVTKRCEME